MAGLLRIISALLDLLVPPSARADPRLRLRHRGIAKSLLSISGVVTILFAVYIAVRPQLGLQEVILFVAAIVSPALGALYVRLTGQIQGGLILTNVAGIAIVAYWCGVTGGIRSVALPWFLPNLFLLSTFGSKRMLIITSGLLFAVIAATTVFFELGKGRSSSSSSSKSEKNCEISKERCRKWRAIVGNFPLFLLFQKIT